MIRKKKHLGFLLIFFFSMNSFSQDVEINNTEIHPKAAAFALEVYQDVIEYQTDKHLSYYSENIRRVSVENLGSDTIVYPSLESIGLRDKYNPNLKVDKEDFDPLNFNPLKYHFEFYNEEVQKFRVENSGYVIVISPYKL